MMWYFRSTERRPGFGLSEIKLERLNVSSGRKAKRD